MKWQIQHRTQYSYAAPARESFNDVRLKPPSDEYQTLESFSLVTTPAVQMREYRDFISNCVHHFEIATPHSSLLIESHALVATHPREPLPADAASVPLATLADSIRTASCFDFLGSSRFVEVEPDIWRLAVDATTGVEDAWQAALAMMKFTHSHIAYTPESTTVHSPVREVLTSRRGVCQDYAHVMLGLCRSLKMPARYVSGYLATEAASATHAWIEVFLPLLGWHPLDPTHNRQIDGTYIKIASGRDYSDVPPVAGYYKGSLQRKMEVEVKIVGA
ncbi:MAG: transglutaminase family protein [Limisphaerales bacterium]